MERSLNFELLRIVAMFMVVMLHVNLFGGVLAGYNSQENPYSFLISHFVESLCIISVNLYVMISGYFLSVSIHPFKVKKLLHITLITVFWSWFIGGMACIFLEANINDFIFNGIFPILSGRYWFVTTYVLMYFLSHYYNKALQVLTKREHFLLILFLGLFFILTPILWDSVGMKSGYSLYWFSYLYIVASFIRRYNIFFSINRLLIMWLIVLLLQVIIVYLLDRFYIDPSILLNYNSVFTFISTLCCFLLFKSFNITKGRMFIQFFSPLILGIYLIHINPATMSWIYKDMFPIKEFADDSKLTMLFSLIGFTILIFIMSAFCEFLRIRIFVLLGIENRIYNFYKRVYIFICGFFSRKQKFSNKRDMVE